MYSKKALFGSFLRKWSSGEAGEEGEGEKGPFWQFSQEMVLR
jgi:hypothetical protein